MKKVIFPLLVLFLLASCGPTIYLAPNFKSVSRGHQTLAVLPFDVTITAKKLPKGVTQEMISEQEKSNAFSMQNNVYTYLLREQAKGKYTVDFQDIDKTNALIKDAGIGFDELGTVGKDKLCEILGVDAVISGKILQEKPMSDGAAVAIGIIFGVWGSTNQVNATLTIHDKNEGKLLWKYDYANSGSVGSSTESLSRALMRNASKKFPYQSK